VKRNAAHDALASLLDFGRVVVSSLSSSAKSLLATVEGASGGGSAERVEGQQVWGHAAVLWRPPGDTEVLFVRNGDELLTVASRETRWQVDLSEGDVCVRNLNGTNPVRLWLKADGTAVLEANTVKIGDAGGTALKGHLDGIKSHLDALQTWASTHTHAGVTTGPGTSGASATPVGSTPPTVPDVESRHKVEN
jgi:hypothetical protein